MWRGSNHGPRPAGADAAGQLIPDAAGEPREDGEELRELAPFGDLRLQASGVQANAPRRDRQRRAVDSIGSHHHIGGADQLPHLDDGRAAERTGHGQVQLLERAHALRSDDRAWPARAQPVGQQYRRRFAQPVKTRLVAGVLERDNQHARRRRHRADARGCRRLRRNTRRGAARDQASQQRSGDALHAAAAGSPALAAADLYLQPTALPTACRPALVHLSVCRQREMVEHPGDRSRIEPAERHLGRFAGFAEKRTPQIDRGGAAPQPDLDPRTRVGRAHERPRGPERAARAKPGRQGADHPSLERRHAADRPVSGVLAGTGHRPIVGVALEAQKAEHGRQRRQPDGPFPKARNRQPVLVELEALGQHVGDRLVQARHEDPPDSRVITHLA